MTRMLAVIPAVISIAVFGVYKFQRSLIYVSNFPEGSRVQVDSPARYGLSFEEVWLKTSDGEKLQMFVMPAPGATKTVLLLNPNAGNIGHSIPLAAQFVKMGHNAILFSYRGYGKSSGTASEAGIKKDCHAVLDYISGDATLSSTKLTLYGRSLGGAVGIYMTHLAQSQGQKVHGLILENTFLSIPKLIPSVLPVLSPLSFLCTEIWDSQQLIPTLSSQTPVLFLSGQQDELVPKEHMAQLYELSASEDKRLIPFKDGTHNDTVAQDGFWEQVEDFCRGL